MKIKIISPSWLDRNGRVIRTKSRLGKFLNLSFIYVAGLTPAGHELSGADDFFEDLDYDEPVDLVGITAMTSQAPRAYQLAAEYRKRGVKVVMGGFHASFCAEEAGAHVDAVVVGEAEQTWAQVIKDAEAGVLKKVYRAELLQSLEGLPSPRYDLVEGKRQRYLYYPLWLGRGCPRDCKFCSVTAFYGNRYRSRPVKDVLRDAELMPGKKVFIIDDNLGAYGDRLDELFPALAPFKFRILAQVDTRFARNEKLLDLAREAGLEGVYVGFESVFPDRLKDLGKEWMRLETVGQAIKNLQQRGIVIGASLIFGIGPESEDTVKRTLDFLTKWKIDTLALYFYSPLPGTALFKEMVEKGVEFSRDWNRYEGRFPTFSYEGVSGEEMEKLYWSLDHGFYRIDNILRRFARWPRKPVIFFTSLSRNLLTFRVDAKHNRSMFYNGANFLDLLPWYSSER